MRRSPFALITALALAAGLARRAGAQVGPLESFSPPSHGASRPLDLARPQADPALDPLCGTTVTGVLVLDRDLVCGFPGLSFGPGATLDLGGFTYEGRLYGWQSVTLRNGTVAHGFIDFYGCFDCRIEEVHVRDGREFVVGLGLRNVVRASRFTGNSVALDLYDFYGGGGDNVVVENEFEDNGIAVNIASYSGTLVASNVFRDNGVGVNLWDEDGFGVNDNTVSDNEFVENGYGITHSVIACYDFSGRCQQGNHLIRNRFRDSENSGMWMDGYGYWCENDYAARCDLLEMVIEGNRFEANGLGPGDDGLTVDAPLEVADGIRVGGNVAAANADLGIEAPGVQDAGENRARRNGNPLQCVGVDCEQLVDVDVWPRRPHARLHPRHGLIPVAILGAPDFDVRAVEVRSLAFGPEGARAVRFPRPRRRDVNRDGVADLLVVFLARTTGIAYGDREGCLSGSTSAGRAFGGCDAIATLTPPGGPRRY